MSFELIQSAEQVFNSISDVSKWWSEDFTGGSHKLNDEFEVRFADVHYSRQRLTEFTPNVKVTWLVTQSRLNFLKDKSEWNNTSIVFEILKQGDNTRLVFTHVGLIPGIECYGDCSNGWKYYLEKSLIPFITTGVGNPNVLEEEIKKKQI